MPIGLVISLIGLSLLSAGLAVYWGVVIGHIVRTRRNIPTARDGVRMVEDAKASGVEWPEVCAIVPAHNEERCIATVAKALIGQEYPKLRIVFALDRCTDGTRRVLEDAVAGDPRVEIVEVTSCPDDWAGKVHAIWRGVQDSEGGRRAHVLTFLDADTTPGARCLWACVSLMRSRGLEMMSLLSTMTGTNWFDRFVEPAAGMELIRQYPLERANERDATKRRAFANGQFIMITREAYQRIGGHEQVRHALLEDIEIAREIARAGMPAGMFIADGVHECRMYESWEQFERGWERIYIESCNRKPERLRQFATRVRVLGVWLPLAAGACLAMALAARGKWSHDPLPIIATICGGIALAIMIVGVLMVYRTSRTPLWGAIGYPVGSWLVGSIMRRAARTLEHGGKTKWGGREYELKAR